LESKNSIGQRRAHAIGRSDSEGHEGVKETEGQKATRLFVRANLKWVAGAAILLLFAYATGSGLVVYSLYAVLLVMALSRAVSEVCLKGLECKRELSKTEMTVGERVEVIFTVKNKGAFPIPWAFVEDLVPEKMPIAGQHARLLTLMPGQEEKMLYQVVFNRRGYHQVGPALMETGDLFGFFRKYKTGISQEYVIVYPSVVQLREYDIAARRPLGAVRVSNKIFEDPTRIIGVREYAPGDPLNRIHWKTTARTGTLYSKVWEPSRVIGATIALDLHQDGYRGVDGKARGELAITIAASLAHYVASANEQVGLITNARDLAETARWKSLPLLGRIRAQIVGRARRTEKPHELAPFMVPTLKGAEQGRLILEALARVDYTDGLRLDKVLLHSIQRLSRDATILLVAPEVTDSMAVAVSILRETGYSVSAFVVNNEVGYFDAVDKLAPAFVDVYHMRDSEDIAKFSTHDIYY
jgi:uncharacterized protein (DUF58 family)